MLTTILKHPPFLRSLSLVLLLLISRIPALSDSIANDEVIRGIDAAVSARDTNIIGYTVTEHYAVFRRQDQEHPVAEMMVKTTYQKDSGKSYAVLSESGSEIWRKQVLDTILENERRLTTPVNRASAMITSANYSMGVKGSDVINGHNCLLVSLTPRRISPFLFSGTIWVDAQDFSIVQLQGVAAKSPSALTGPAEVSRQYAPVGGFPMATHAKAVSTSWLLGQTTIKIDYTGYEIKLRTAQ
jgi:hypothetical protein